MRFKLLVFSFLTLAISCSKTNESNKICFTRTSTDLNIKNNTGKTIYFISFGEDVLPLIDWIPNCSNNSVPANSSVSKKLATLTGYSAEDKLAVYWWECTANNAGEIHFMLLDKYEKECH